MEGKGGGFGMMAGLQAQVGDAMRNGAQQAQDYAERICTKLDVIAEGSLALGAGESERITISAAVEAASTEKFEPARRGWLATIEHISVVADAATTVDIHVGTDGNEGFRERLTFAAAGRDSSALTAYRVPEGAPVFAVVGAGAARVNIQLRREKVY